MTLKRPKNMANEDTDEPFGRHDDPTPVKCNRCGWHGQIKDMIHDYRDDGSGEDVEAVDECPECGTDDVEEFRIVEK